MRCNIVDKDCHTFDRNCHTNAIRLQHRRTTFASENKKVKLNYGEKREQRQVHQHVGNGNSTDACHHRTGYYRIGDYSAVSASMHYFSLGEVYTNFPADGNTSSVESTTIKPYEMSFDVAYSLMLSEKFSIAAGVRFLLSDMSYTTTEETSAATAFAADLACYYQNMST